MATDKKHIAVYLDPAVEQALIAFCEQKGLISKKGTMFSAGVNAALAAFFGIADIDNILQSSGNIPTVINTIPDPTTSSIPAESIDIGVLPGKPEGLNDGEADSLKQELEVVRAENQRLHIELDNLRGAFPDAADLLNKLKAKRKKATASLADIEAFLEILEGR
jgi:hypothetical protein